MTDDDEILIRDLPPADPDICPRMARLGIFTTNLVEQLIALDRIEKQQEQERAEAGAKRQAEQEAALAAQEAQKDA